MTSQTVAGTTFSISAGAPATQDSAGFTALAFTVIGGVEKLGGIGATYAKVEFQPLNGPKDKLKGPPDYGSLSPSIALDSSDAGQTLLQTAAADETNKLFSFKVIRQDGAIRYFQGRCMGMPETYDAAGSVLMATPSIEICRKVVPVAAT